MGIGNKIKEYRIKKGITQKELADSVFVTYQAVSRWENEETEPSIETIKLIAKTLDCSINDLLEIEESNNEPEVVERVVEKVVVEKAPIVLATCEECANPITEKEDYHNITLRKKERSGRTYHIVETKKILCTSCNNKRLREEARIDKINEANFLKTEKNKRVRSYIISALVFIIFLVIAIVGYAKGNPAVGTTFLILSLLLAPLACCVSLDNTWISEWWMDISEFGIKMPGIIFSADLDGVIFLIVMKVVLYLLGIALMLLGFAFASVVLCPFSIFVLPTALKRSYNAKYVKKEI